MLNPVHLHTLAVVLRVGSFADAARQLGYTGSAVSQQISLLERQLHTTLFEREAHSIRPTPVATLIVERSASAMGALQALEDDIGQIVGGVKGSLRIGSFSTAGEHLIPEALADLRRNRPELGIYLDEGEPRELVPLLKSRELDVALVYRYNLVPQPWPRSLPTSSVLKEDLLLIRRAARGAKATPEAIALDEFSGDAWIATRDGTSGAATLQQLWWGKGLDVEVAYRSNNYGVIQGLVRKGLGVALVPAMSITSREGLAVSRLADVEAYREVLVASAPTALPALVEAFEASVRSAAGRLAHRKDGVTVAGAASAR